MANEDKGSTSGADLLKIGLIVGGVALIGWGGYKLYTAIFGNKDTNDKTYQTIITEYLNEIQERDALMNSCIKKKSMTDIEKQQIDFMSADIAQKEIAAKNINNSWLTNLSKDLQNFGKEFGLWFALPGVLTAGTLGYLYYAYRNKWWPMSRGQIPPPPQSPPPPPPGAEPPPTPVTCPFDGLEFPTAADFTNHFFAAHPAVTNPAARQAAQAAYNQLSGVTRGMVDVAISPTMPAVPRTNWGGIASITIQAIAAAIVIGISMGAAAPVLGGIEGGLAIATDGEIMASGALGVGSISEAAIEGATAAEVNAWLLNGQTTLVGCLVK